MHTQKFTLSLTEKRLIYGLFGGSFDFGVGPGNAQELVQAQYDIEEDEHFKKMALETARRAEDPLIEHEEIVKAMEDEFAYLADMYDRNDEHDYDEAMVKKAAKEHGGAEFPKPLKPKQKTLTSLERRISIAKDILEEVRNEGVKEQEIEDTSTASEEGRSLYYEIIDDSEMLQKARNSIGTVSSTTQGNFKGTAIEAKRNIEGKAVVKEIHELIIVDHNLAEVQKKFESDVGDSSPKDFFSYLQTLDFSFTRADGRSISFAPEPLNKNYTVGDTLHVKIPYATGLVGDNAVEYAPRPEPGARVYIMNPEQRAGAIIANMGEVNDLVYGEAFGMISSDAKRFVEQGTLFVFNQKGQLVDIIPSRGSSGSKSAGLGATRRFGLGTLGLQDYKNHNILS